MMLEEINIWSITIADTCISGNGFQRNNSNILITRHKVEQTFEFLHKLDDCLGRQ